MLIFTNGSLESRKNSRYFALLDFEVPEDPKSAILIDLLRFLVRFVFVLFSG